MFIATKLLGLTVGNSYTVKGQPSSRVWVLHVMTDKDVALLHIPFLEATKKLTMKFKEDEIEGNQGKASIVGGLQGPGCFGSKHMGCVF